MIGRTMPEGVWLNNLSIDSHNGIGIVGTSKSEDLVYDFVRYLSQVPLLKNVNLVGQKPIRLRDELAIRFDISCHSSLGKPSAERKASGD